LFSKFHITKPSDRWQLTGSVAGLTELTHLRSKEHSALGMDS